MRAGWAIHSHIPFSSLNPALSQALHHVRQLESRAASVGVRVESRIMGSQAWLFNEELYLNEGYTPLNVPQIYQMQAESDTDIVLIISPGIFDEPRFGRFCLQVPHVFGYDKSDDPGCEVHTKKTVNNKPYWQFRDLINKVDCGIEPDIYENALHNYNDIFVIKDDRLESYRPAFPGAQEARFTQHFLINPTIFPLMRNEHVSVKAGVNYEELFIDPNVDSHKKYKAILETLATVLKTMLKCISIGMEIHPYTISYFKALDNTLVRHGYMQGSEWRRVSALFLVLKHFEKFINDKASVEDKNRLIYGLKQFSIMLGYSDNYLMHLISNAKTESLYVNLGASVLPYDIFFLSEKYQPPLRYFEAAPPVVSMVLVRVPSPAITITPSPESEREVPVSPVTIIPTPEPEREVPVSPVTIIQTPEPVLLVPTPVDIPVVQELAKQRKSRQLGDLKRRINDLEKNKNKWKITESDANYVIKNLTFLSGKIKNMQEMLEINDDGVSDREIAIISNKISSQFMLVLDLTKENTINNIKKKPKEKVSIPVKKLSSKPEVRNRKTHEPAAESKVQKWVSAEPAIAAEPLIIAPPVIPEVKAPIVTSHISNTEIDPNKDRKKQILNLKNEASKLNLRFLRVMAKSSHKREILDFVKETHAIYSRMISLMSTENTDESTLDRVLRDFSHFNERLNRCEELIRQIAAPEVIADKVSEFVLDAHFQALSHYCKKSKNIMLKIAYRTTVYMFVLSFLAASLMQSVKCIDIAKSNNAKWDLVGLSLLLLQTYLNPLLIICYRETKGDFFVAPMAVTSLASLLYSFLAFAQLVIRFMIGQSITGKHDLKNMLLMLVSVVSVLSVLKFKVVNNDLTISLLHAPELAPEAAPTPSVAPRAAPGRRR